MSNVQLAAEKHLNFINGEWTGGNLKTFDVINPANGEVIAKVPNSGKAETDEAIEAAHTAFQSWSKTAATERAQILRKVAEMMHENKEELAKIMTLEMGKPLAESRGEVNYAASFLEWYAEEARRVYGRTVPGRSANNRIQIVKQPVGVVAAITPWNFPAAMITRKLGPALAAGCTIVIKPAESTPLTAMKLMEFCEEAGVPKGVVNLVTGNPGEIGEAFMSNPKVRKVTFTGSTAVGKHLIRQSADTVKNISLELGGHAPLIIFDDADIEKAVQGAIASKYRNAGQTCICINRIYVQANVYEKFVSAFKEAVSQLKVGNGLDEGVDIGPMINKAGYEKVDKHVQDAVSKGAEVVIGGQGEVLNDNACFYHPTIIKDVTPEMVIMSEETFGPVAPIQKFETEEEVIEFANNTPYGLSAYFYTESVTRGTKIMESLDYGIVGWNDALPSTAQAPFGGMKESGIGREGGIEGIEPYLETKYVSLGL
ncbi:NAD-dependent succinate-semialdehyde dehydrogenase [Domibacillus mangrovi]|uniref:Aldehyde dehydrogenase n=1 Tax=Domibacillus mangrovi TaxID=1714354 RepID=A0A1Q5P0C1_9BACI|nr:NAD-dependent succinate-semialdehyde dehydrogenase [Domibacillus mangrovi]OKL35618.1 succinate-semialdehyde dehydrogenase (NADP(+)) [Domibacillus mangrovi]